MSSPGDPNTLSASAAGSIVQTPWYRWAQLIMGVACMALVANLQYGWTLFVSPIDAKYHWGRADIQIAFSIFVVIETWLVPIEGWLVDKFGPRPVIAGGAILAGIAWVMNSYASSLFELYTAALDAEERAARVYAGLVTRAGKLLGSEDPSAKALRRLA